MKSKLSKMEGVQILKTEELKSITGGNFVYCNECGTYYLGGCPPPSQCKQK